MDYGFECRELIIIVLEVFLEHWSIEELFAGKYYSVTYEFGG